VAVTTQISLSNLSGHNLRSSLIRAGPNTAGEEEHHCETVMDCEEKIVINGQPRWFKIDSSLLDVPGNDDQLRMIVMRDITKVDVRLLSASNQDLGDLVDDHSFRADLSIRKCPTPDSNCRKVETALENASTRRPVGKTKKQIVSRDRSPR